MKRVKRNMIITCSLFLMMCLTATGQNNRGSVTVSAEVAFFAEGTMASKAELAEVQRETASAEALAKAEAECEESFHEIYQKYRTTPSTIDGQHYQLLCRYVVLNAKADEPDVDTVEMRSDGKSHFYKSRSVEMYGDGKVSVYVNKDRRQILINEALPKDITTGKMNFSKMADDSLFKYSRLTFCGPVKLEGGQPCTRVEFTVLPDYRGRVGLRKMEYYIDEANNKIKQVQLVYHNRPDVKRMLVVFEEAGYVEGEVLAGKATDCIYDHRKLRPEYIGYSVTDRTR